MRLISILVTVMALPSLTVSPATAAEQVLTCAAETTGSGDAQVLISEGMFKEGTIMWPSQAGTTVYKIKEKTSVSYAAAEDDANAKRPSRLYINRLNGALHIEFATNAELIGALKGVCTGAVTPHACAQQLEGQSAAARSLCFAPLDCSKITDAVIDVVQANYKCRRSFKKF